MPELHLALLAFRASPVPACCVFLVPQVTVLVRVAVNHFIVIISVIKLASVGLGGMVQSDTAMFAGRLLPAI